MVNCCIPLCGSCQGRPNISFHEIPVNVELRLKWIHNIQLCKKNWLPRECDRVCCRHFRPEDYKPGLKIRKLKPDSVPTVFPNGPRGVKRVASHEANVTQKSTPDEETSSVNEAPSNLKLLPLRKPLPERARMQIVRQAKKLACRKRIILIKKGCSTTDPSKLEETTGEILRKVLREAQQSAPRKLNTQTNFAKYGNKATNSVSNISGSGKTKSHLLSTYDRTEGLLSDVSANDKTGHTLSNISASHKTAKPLPNGSPKNALVSLIKVHRTPSSTNSCISNTTRVATINSERPQTPKRIGPSFQLSAEFLQVQALNKKVRAVQSRFRRLQKRHEEVKNRVVQLEVETAALKASTISSSVSKISEKAEEGNLLALFLRQQIHAFSKKRVLWHDEVLKHCKAWRARSPMGYEYVREMRLLKLPSRTTLEREGGDVNKVNVEITSATRNLTSTNTDSLEQAPGDVGNEHLREAPLQNGIAEATIVPVKTKTAAGGVIDMHTPDEGNIAMSENEITTGSVNDVPLGELLTTVDMGGGQFTEIVFVTSMGKEAGAGDMLDVPVTEIVTFVPLENALTTRGIRNVDSTDIVDVGEISNLHSTEIVDISDISNVHSTEIVTEDITDVHSTEINTENITDVHSSEPVMEDVHSTESVNGDLNNVHSMTIVTEDLTSVHSNVAKDLTNVHSTVTEDVTNV